MKTKKQINTQEQDTTLNAVLQTFTAQKWIRYTEYDLKNKAPYIKKIIFKFPDKIEISYFLEEKTYIKWREKISELVK